jgi:hypothetical protein
VFQKNVLAGYTGWRRNIEAAYVPLPGGGPVGWFFSYLPLFRELDMCEKIGFPCSNTDDATTQVWLRKRSFLVHRCIIKIPVCHVERQKIYAPTGRQETQIATPSACSEGWPPMIISKTGDPRPSQLPQRK